MFSKKHYSKTVLHPKSQFSYSGGKSSCTYCSLEASIWLLRRLVFHDDPNLKGTIEKIIKTGVGYDQQLGHRSCDEAFHAVKRYQHAIVMGNLYFGRIKPNCYFNLLSQIEARANGLITGPVKKEGDDPKKEEENKKKEEENKKKEEEAKKATPIKRSIAVVLTKPPETILVFHDPFEKRYPFVIFDSHPRSFELFRGAGFYFFSSKVDCSKHLDMLFPAMNLNMGKKDSYDAKKYDTYEANYLQLRSTSDFMTATTFEKKKPPIIKAKIEEEDRDIISSIIVSQMKKDEVQRKLKEAAEAKKKKKEEKPKEKAPEKVEGKVELSEKKILLDTISTLRKELEKVKKLLKENEKKVKEQEFMNESLSKINEVSKIEIEELKKKNASYEARFEKIHGMTSSESLKDSI